MQEKIHSLTILHGAVANFCHFSANNRRKRGFFVDIFRLSVDYFKLSISVHLTTPIFCYGSAVPAAHRFGVVISIPVILKGLRKHSPPYPKNTLPLPPPNFAASGDIYSWTTTRVFVAQAAKSGQSVRYPPALFQHLFFFKQWWCKHSVYFNHFFPAWLS